MVRIQNRTQPLFHYEFHLSGPEYKIFSPLPPEAILTSLDVQGYRSLSEDPQTSHPSTHMTSTYWPYFPLSFPPLKRHVLFPPRRGRDSPIDLFPSSLISEIFNPKVWTQLILFTLHFSQPHLLLAQVRRWCLLPVAQAYSHLAWLPISHH